MSPILRRAMGFWQLRLWHRQDSHRSSARQHGQHPGPCNQPGFGRANPHALVSWSRNRRACKREDGDCISEGSDITRERGDQWSQRRPPIVRRGALFPAPRRTAWCAAVLLVLASLAACGWLIREPLLRGAANLWIVSDPVGRATAIVVLGGGFETRPFVAAELWQR